MGAMRPRSRAEKKLEEIKKRRRGKHWHCPASLLQVVRGKGRSGENQGLLLYTVCYTVWSGRQLIEGQLLIQCSSTAVVELMLRKAVRYGIYRYRYRACLSGFGSWY